MLRIKDGVKEERNASSWQKQQALGFLVKNWKRTLVAQGRSRTEPRPAQDDEINVGLKPGRKVNREGEGKDEAEEQGNGEEDETIQLKMKKTCLVIQWLRHCASTAGGTGLSPDGGTKILYAGQNSQKKKKKVVGGTKEMWRERVDQGRSTWSSN